MERGDRQIKLKDDIQYSSFIPWVGPQFELLRGMTIYGTMFTLPPNAEIAST